MNKAEFMNSLEGLLRDIPYDDKKEILYDYEEHFTIGAERGKTEEEIAESLGNPQNIARQFIADYKLNRAETDASTRNIFSAILAVMALGFFNLIFVLGPFLGLLGALIGLFAAAIAITLSGIGVFVGSLFSPYLLSFISLPPGFNLRTDALIFLSIGMASLGALSTIGVVMLGRLFYNLTIKYLKFNLRLIRK